eukprot:3938029-Rhodomonas_salina.8
MGVLTSMFPTHAPHGTEHAMHPHASRFSTSIPATIDLRASYAKPGTGIRDQRKQKAECENLVAAYPTSVPGIMYQ